ncbi:MAG: hypothetical protein ACI841_000569 [Planctomycetota bacterium]|jgi:hypothetical protein
MGIEFEMVVTTRRVRNSALLLRSGSGPGGSQVRPRGGLLG